MDEKEKNKSTRKTSDVIVDGKKYTIDVGVDLPYVGVDDVFEMELTLFQDEIDTLIIEGKKLLWVDNDLLAREFLEFFVPKAYKRANKLAEEYAVARWGEQMLIENGVPESVDLFYQWKSYPIEGSQWGHVEISILVPDERLKEKPTYYYKEKE